MAHSTGRIYFYQMFKGRTSYIIITFLVNILRSTNNFYMFPNAITFQFIKQYCMRDAMKCVGQIQKSLHNKII